MSAVPESHKRQYRIIYELLWSKDPRIYVKDIASVLHVDPRTASRRIREAFELGYIVGPQIRKRSYANMTEYMYFTNCKNPLEAYKRYSKDENVLYHAVMAGFANLWVVSRKEIEVEGDIVLEGLRSDYYVSHAPDHSWETAKQVMQRKVEEFNLEEYTSTGFIKNQWNKTIEWDIEFEKLYREFKYNLRKSLTPIMKKHLISGQKIYEFLDNLFECCTIATCYFPEGISLYDPYLFLFETDYPDFVIELFSELPTSPFFFQCSDKLFLRSYVERQFLRCEDLQIANIGQLYIPLLIYDLLKKGIIKSEEHAIIEYSWSKDL